VYVPRIVITSGEPAGIGPDACVMLAQENWQADIVVAADASLISATAHALSVPLDIKIYDSSQAVAAHRAGILKVLHLPAPQPVVRFAGGPVIFDANRRGKPETVGSH